MLREEGGHEIAGLLTTLNEAFDRVAMHAVRRSLLEQQATLAGVPLVVVPLPWPCSNQEYARRMVGVCGDAVDGGVEGVAFGDLFLEDVRAYREKQLEGTGLTPLFPLWGLNTADLARRMIDSGLEAHLTCVDPKVLDRGFAGRRFDHQLLESLPTSVDPCGEEGEFHTFVSAGPMFGGSIPVRVGETVERDGFVFADLTLDGDR